MRSLSRTNSEGLGLSTGSGVFLALVWGIGSLWFSRSHFFNSDRVGWGDPSADRDQSLFWWGTVIGSATSLLMAMITGIRSAGFRFAVWSTATLMGILTLLAIKFSLKYAEVRLLPGLLAYGIAFGVHSDARNWIDSLWLFWIHTVLYAAMVAGILALPSRRRPPHGAKR